MGDSSAAIYDSLAVFNAPPHSCTMGYDLLPSTMAESRFGLFFLPQKHLDPFDRFFKSTVVL